MLIILGRMEKGREPRRAQMIHVKDDALFPCKKVYL